MTDTTKPDALTMSEDEYRKARMVIRFGNFNFGAPKPPDPAKVDAMKMTPEEYAKARRAFCSTGRPR